MNKQTTINQKLQYLFLSIASYLAVMMLVITVLSYVVVMRKAAREEGLELNDKNRSIINLNFDTLYTSFLYEFGTEKFLYNFMNMIQEKVSIDQSTYSFQNELSAFCQRNPMLVSAVILDLHHNHCYSRYTDRIRVPAESLLTQNDLDMIDGITWLPSRKVPLPYGQDALCLVLPLVCETYLKIAKTPESADALLIAYVKESHFENLISSANESAIGHTFFLYTDKGQLIKGIGPAADKKAVVDKVRIHLGIEKYEDFMSIVRTNHIITRKLYVVDYTDKVQKFLSFLGSIGLVYFGTLITVCIMIVVSNHFMKKNISDPINTLLEGVDYIKKGDFTHKIALPDDDELGILATQINDMSYKITQQMKAIREKEEIQYQTELKLLTEQLNPHFLYNTLEYIRQGIISSSTEKADIAITHLSKYLRTALAHGQDMVPISNEIKHIISYVKIMECRFDHIIDLKISDKSGISESYILKTMLQPIVENAIKHGFSIDSSIPSIHAPTIEITFTRIGDDVCITVTDNGCGFDVEAVKRLMYRLDGREEHIGLANTYARMQKFYGKGKAAISFASIPFYANTVTLQVPYRTSKEKVTS
ncbi:MAG: histidine kinase [Treponema sp.]|nr:histidine kinase [Treponema sp.]